MSIRKYTWRDLIGEPQLCEGGHLASIVFCCDPRKRPCPILEAALRMLGLRIENYLEVVKKHSIKIKTIDGTCFGDLAFCPGLDKPSKDRDMALQELGWTVVDYLKYKFEILLDLVGEDKLEQAFTARFLKQYAITLLDLESRREYKCLALGNLDCGILMVIEIFDENKLSNDALGSILEETEYVGVRIPRSLVKKLDELVEHGIVKSRSDGIRRALALYLSMLSVKQVDKR